MKYSSQTTSKSCSVRESFDHPSLTAHGGANLLVDLLRHPLDLRRCFDNLPFQKSPWSTYTLADELETLMVAYGLGVRRIAQTDEMERDPLLKLKLGLSKLPQHNTLYRALDRFNCESRVAALGGVNRQLLPRILEGQDHAILDIDTTVETVHGDQKGSCVANNPRYPGRSSYQPLIAFEGQSKSTVFVQLRSGKPPHRDEKVAFYQQAKEQLPPSCTLRFVRADKAFPSEDFCAELERDEVGYAMKLRFTSRLAQRLNLGVMWHRLASHESTEIEAGAVPFQAHGWSKRRRIVLIRSRLRDETQLSLFDEFTWEYQAIVTNLDWHPEDVWHFYNQRCTCETLIKEMKGGLGINAISKADFWPNAADLWIKTLTYNALLILKTLAPSPYRTFSIARLRRAIFRVPAILSRHARSWTLRLPAYWPHKAAWCSLRANLQPAH